MLGRAKGPWQPALGATLPGPAGCALVHNTLCARYPTCCPVACAGARQRPLVASTGCYLAGACWVCPSAQHFVCPLPHLPPGSVCWGTPRALGSQHWVLPCRGPLGVPQCTTLCVPTTPLVARQRVLGRVGGPWQPTLGAAPPGPVGCAPVHRTLCAHCPTCCPAACARARWGPLAASTWCYLAGACWVCLGV